MMTYEIISAEQNAETINTNVKYDINGTIVETIVSHFMPKTIDDIYNGVVNRAYSEEVRLDAIARNQILLPEIQTGSIVPISGSLL